MTFELVDKEMSTGNIAGSTYGAAVRVIARSPTHVMFSARGLQVWNRKEHGAWHNTKLLTRKSASKATYAEIAARIDEIFGDGAAGYVSAASGKSKTLLVDGGGEPMPLPRVQYIKKVDEARRTVTPDWRADLTGRIRCCRQCDAALRPDVDYHRMGFTLLPNHPKSMEDCQRMTNNEVIAVHGYDTRYKDRWEYVERFDTWDGESYLDDTFCSNQCAALYGRRAARAFEPLPVGVALPKEPQRERSDVDYAPKKPEQTFTLGDGKVIKV